MPRNREVVKGLNGLKNHVNNAKQGSLALRMAGMKRLPGLVRQSKQKLPQQKIKYLQDLANIKSNLMSPGGINASKPPSKRVRPPLRDRSQHEAKKARGESGPGFQPSAPQLTPVIV